MAKKKYEFTTYDAARRLRNDWGNTNPTTKIFKDKTKYSRKEKHKKNFDF